MRGVKDQTRRILQRPSNHVEFCVKYSAEIVPLIVFTLCLST